MKQSIRLCLILIIACLPFAINVKAVSADTQYEVVILDDADLLSDSETDALYSEMGQLSEYGNVMFTTTYVQGSNFESNCENTYYEWFGNEPGLNFQIDMNNRKITLSASTEMEELIGSERDSIVDNVYHYATDGDYYRCASRCFDQVYTVINDGYIAHTMKHIDNAILAVLFALVVNYIIVFSSRKKKASEKELVDSLDIGGEYNGASIKKGKLVKEYSPQSSDSSGSSGGGGGGGGGGFSGGSSSHGF